MSLALRTVTSGNPNGPTVVFLHGWPDDSSLFESMAGALAKDFYCARFSLPNFGAPGPDNKITRLGFSFDEIVDLLVQAVREIQSRRGRQQEPVSLVLHDWGCSYGYLFERRYPELVKCVVALDIGYHIKPSAKEFVMIAAYQWYLIFAWVIGLVVSPVGNFMTRMLAWLFKAPAPSSHVHSAMNYPYVQFWKTAITAPSKLRPLKARGLCPFPCLFLYGRKKPLMFHSRAFLEAIGKRDDSASEGFDSDHWFLARLPEQVNARVSLWLRQRHNLARQLYDL